MQRGVDMNRPLSDILRDAAEVPELRRQLVDLERETVRKIAMLERQVADKEKQRAQMAAELKVENKRRVQAEDALLKHCADARAPTVVYQCGDSTELQVVERKVVL